MEYSGRKLVVGHVDFNGKVEPAIVVVAKPVMKSRHTHNHKMNKLMKSRLRSKAGRVYARVKSIRLLQKLDKS